MLLEKEISCIGSYCTLVEDNFQIFLPASTPELCAVTKMDHGSVKQAN